MPGNQGGPDETYLTAIVVQRNVDWGLMRAFNAHRERATDAVQNFHEFSEVLNFVGVKERRRVISALLVRGDQDYVGLF